MTVVCKPSFQKQQQRDLRNRKLKARWSVEMEQDLEAFYGIDLETTLTVPKPPDLREIYLRILAKNLNVTLQE